MGARCRWDRARALRLGALTLALQHHLPLELRPLTERHNRGTVFLPVHRQRNRHAHEALAVPVAHVDGHVSGVALRELIASDFRRLGGLTLGDIQGLELQSGVITEEARAFANVKNRTTACALTRMLLRSMSAALRPLGRSRYPKARNATPAVARPRPTGVKSNMLKGCPVSSSRMRETMMLGEVTTRVIKPPSSEPNAIGIRNSEGEAFDLWAIWNARRRLG
jgi:hypothetical protein